MNGAITAQEAARRSSASQRRTLPIAICDYAERFPSCLPEPRRREGTPQTGDHTFCYRCSISRREIPLRPSADRDTALGRGKRINIKRDAPASSRKMSEKTRSASFSRSWCTRVCRHSRSCFLSAAYNFSSPFRTRTSITSATAAKASSIRLGFQTGALVDLFKRSSGRREYCFPRRDGVFLAVILQQKFIRGNQSGVPPYLPWRCHNTHRTDLAREFTTSMAPESFDHKYLHLHRAVAHLPFEAVLASSSQHLVGFLHEVIALGGLQSIPDDLYEAEDVDGASNGSSLDITAPLSGRS